MSDDIERAMSSLERAVADYKRYVNTVYFGMALLRLNTFVEDFAAYSQEAPATRDELAMSDPEWRANEH